jgi:hypothetical protein
MRRLFFALAALVLASGFERAADAASATFLLNMDGSQEVNNPGDLDGSAMGTISLDDVSGEISWNLTYSDIADPTLMHIHGPDGSAGSNAGVFIGLGVVTSGGPGTLIDSFVHGDLGQISSVLANPTDFYVNIHNADFGPGAVRGQLGTFVPEPFSVALLGLGVAAFAIRRRLR